MISYNNGNVLQYIRQYEMFANSLNLVKSTEEREMIIKQLTKLENKIIDATREKYEEEYYKLANSECALLDDEKKRIAMLIELINQRLSYVEKRCNDHYQLTGNSIDVSDVLGATTLEELEAKIKIIDKYSKNVKLAEDLKEEIRTLSSKISLASEKMDINKTLNIELEAKFKNVLSSAFERLGLFDLLDSKSELEETYYEVEKAMNMAQVNLDVAKTSPINLLDDCNEMFHDIKKDYAFYKDKISIIKLMEIFNREVNTYEELLNKRIEVNDLFDFIIDESLKSMVWDDINKQYNTIVMEQQDINTYRDLTIEKDRKLEALSEIEEENNSDEFQNILKTLIENEKKQQERIEEEKRRVEAEEKKKRLEIERKRQEEILKRQKIIEEARKKEIEKRTRELLEQQQNSVLQSKKRETLSNEVSFETMKDISNNDNEKNTIISRKESLINKIEENPEEDNKMSINSEEIKDNADDNLLFKNKVDIENELFEEFNNNENIDDKKVVTRSDLFERLSELTSSNDDFSHEDKVEKSNVSNKLPEMSVDDYMKKFGNNDNNDDSFFGGNDIFPSIPM